MNDRLNNILFITDLDGTLLNEHSKVSAKSVKLLNAAIDRGINLSIATARTPATVEGLMSEVNTRLPLIVMTGAAMWQPRTGEFLNIRYIEPDSLGVIRDCCECNGLVPFLFILPGDGKIHMWHPAAMTAAERKFTEERSHLPLKKLHIGDIRYGTICEGVVLIFATAPWRQIVECAESLRKSGLCTVQAYHDIFNHEWGFLEVFAPGTSKESAMESLRAIAGCSEVVAFGDNLNDIGMLERATKGISVANAFPAVKEVADEVIGPNTTDSVAEYIARESRFLE